MLLAYPKLTDDKWLRQRAVLALFFAGFDENSMRYKIELVFGWRPDLMHPRFDRGKVIPCVLGFQWAWAAKGVRMIVDDKRLKFRFRFRSEASEIARRLAGGDE